MKSLCCCHIGSSLASLPLWEMCQLVTKSPGRASLHGAERVTHPAETEAQRVRGSGAGPLSVPPHLGSSIWMYTSPQ